MMSSDFHIFEYLNKEYIINVNDVTVCSFDSKTSALAEKSGNRLSDKSHCQKERPNSKEYLEKRNIPITSIALFVTQLCNLKCIYCYGEHGTYGASSCPAMTEERALLTVDWLIEKSGNFKYLNIHFFGGEPFINFPLIKKIVEYSQRRGNESGKIFIYTVTTNGTLLDDEIINFLHKHSFKVLVSFDGDKETQDRQRPFPDGTGSYDKTIPKIKSLLDKAPETECRATIMEGANPDTVITALRNIGFTSIDTTPASPSLFDLNRGQKHSERNFNETLESIESETENWTLFSKNRNLEELKKLSSSGVLRKYIAAFLNKEKKLFNCHAGISMAAVSCAGDIFPCHRFVGSEEYKMGSIYKKDLLRSPYMQSPTKSVEKCSKCFAKYICAGGCKHDNAGTCGSPFSPAEDMCSLTRRCVELSAYICCNLEKDDAAFLFKNNIIYQKPCPFDF